MGGEKYTVLFVSEKAEQTRRFHLSQISLRLLILLIVFLVVGSISAIIYSTIHFKNMGELISENSVMKADRQEVIALIRDLQRIKEMDVYVRQSLGVPISYEGDESEIDQSSSIPISYLQNAPSQVPAFGFVTQEFSQVSSGIQSGHTGLDIAAPLRTAVHATAAGLVVFSGWHHSYGNLIILSHGNGYFSLYGHNANNLVEERNKVDRGELIALLGESGVTSGPHLHFEIWKDSDPVNPTLFIPEYR